MQKLLQSLIVTLRQSNSMSLFVFMSRYQKIEPKSQDSAAEILGDGAYGVVYKAIDYQTHQFVALKRIKLESENEGIPTTALREITLLRMLRHENVVALKDVVMENDRLYLIFELIDTDLKKYMDNTPGMLCPQLVQSYTSQIIEGLAYCHSMGIMHRDLKPQNILVSRDGGLKLADFGLARTFTPSHRALTTAVITRWYRPPEILLGGNIYDASVDMWSVGCVILGKFICRPFGSLYSDVCFESRLVIFIIFVRNGKQTPHFPRPV